MTKLKKCPICGRSHRLKKMYNKCVRRKERAKQKPCKHCGVKHRKQSAINRCERRHKKESW